MLKFLILKALWKLNLVSKERVRLAEALYRLRKSTNYRLIAKSKYFNKRWYLKHYPDVKKDGMDPIFHYMDYGWKEGREPGKLFSGNLYLRNYPDVKSAKMNPLVHYLRYGQYEGRRGPVVGYLVYNLIKHSSFFNFEWYLRQYPDVAKSGIDPLIHYLSNGWEEGRNPSGKFDTKFYLKSYPDVDAAGICPLIHYIKSGKREGRVPSGTQETSVFSFPKSRTLSYLKRMFFRCVSSSLIKKNRNKKIAVHLHLYYTELWPEIKLYLSNLGCYDFDLYITHTQPLPQKVTDAIKAFKPGVVFLKVENRGFDLGPFVFFLHYVDLAKYDILFKIHTKRNTVGHNYYGLYMAGNDWRKFLYDGVLGERTVHKVIDVLGSDDSNVGMMAHKKLIANDDLNFERAETMRAMTEYKLPIPERYQFIMGTMFAARASLFKRIKKAVTIDSFEPSQRDVFSLAHMFERILSLNVLAQGYTLAGYNTFCIKGWYRALQAKLNPYKDNGFLDRDNLKPYTFYRKRNTAAGKNVLVCSLLKEKNKELFDTLLKKSTYDPSVDEPVDPHTHTYQFFMKNLVIDRKIAEIVSRAETTIFRFVGNDVSVEKHVNRRCFSRLQVCDAPPVFIQKGRYLYDMLESNHALTSHKAIVSFLLPYFKAVFARFKTSNPQLLASDAWDALPRNTLVTKQGTYSFFDCNIKFLCGVPKSYFIFRVLYDLSCHPSFAKELGAVHREMSPAAMALYEKLCKRFDVKPKFKHAQRLERHLQLGLVSRLSLRANLYEYAMTLLCRCGMSWLSRLCDCVFFNASRK